MIHKCEKCLLYAGSGCAAQFCLDFREYDSPIREKWGGATIACTVICSESQICKVGLSMCLQIIEYKNTRYKFNEYAQHTMLVHICLYPNLLTQALLEDLKFLKFIFFLVDGFNFWISFPPLATLCNSGETGIADERGDASPRL